MGRPHETIDHRLAEWIEAQPVFFVATAPSSPTGHVNCSPKGNRRELVVLSDSSVAYLDQTGSGAETIAHLLENGRIVLMFCAFDGPPRIVRIHGHGRVLLASSDGFEEVASRFGGASGVGVRSVIVVEATRIADSCGYGVPMMRMIGHREVLDEWAIRKGRDGIEKYWKDNNALSIDSLPGMD